MNATTIRGRPNTYRRVVFAIAGLVLVVAVVAVSIGAGYVPKRNFHGTLAELVPSARDLPGWTRKNRDVAESIEVARYIKEYLGYDDAIYVDFSRGDLRISVYASYWKPGKISSEWVASHTPDLCWVEAGWKNLHRDTRDIPIPSGNGRKWTMENRTFQYAGQNEHVVFCHIVGGRIATYTGVGPRPSRINGFLERVQNREWSRPDAEQLFLRVSSNRPLVELLDAAPFEIMLRRIDKNYLGRFD